MKRPSMKLLAGTVTAGHMTQAQATAREQKIDAKLPKWISHAQARSNHRKRPHAMFLQALMMKEMAEIVGQNSMGRPEIWDIFRSSCC